MSAQRPWDIRRSVRRHLVLSLAAAALLTVGLGGWAATTELAGAVVAPGTLVVDSFVKKVQHPTGGVVGELRVRDGDLVRAGQVVMRLDETVTRANLAVVDKSLAELTARQGRLEAERDGAPRVSFAAVLRGRALGDPEAGRVMAGETRLFELRRDARAGQKAAIYPVSHRGNQHISRLHRLRQFLGGKGPVAFVQPGIEQLLHPELDGRRKFTGDDDFQFAGRHGTPIGAFIIYRGLSRANPSRQSL